MKQTFWSWQTGPISFPSFDYATFLRVIENGFFNKIKNKWQVKIKIVLLFDQLFCHFFIKQWFVHCHKVTFDVEFKDIAIFGIVLWTGADKMVYPFYSVMCSFAFAATVAVVDKNFFKNRGNVIVNKMMDYPVAEIGGKNLAFYRFINNEANTWFGLIPVFKNFIANVKILASKCFSKSKAFIVLRLFFRASKYAWNKSRVILSLSTTGNNVNCCMMTWIKTHAGFYPAWVCFPLRPASNAQKTRYSCYCCFCLHCCYCSPCSGSRHYLYCSQMNSTSCRCCQCCWTFHCCCGCLPERLLKQPLSLSHRHLQPMQSFIANANLASTPTPLKTAREGIFQVFTASAGYRI